MGGTGGYALMVVVSVASVVHVVVSSMVVSFVGITSSVVVDVVRVVLFDVYLSPFKQISNSVYRSYVSRI